MTDEQFSKLPKFAQQEIIELRREREVAIRALNKYVDCQTPAPFYIDELESTGETQGPSWKRRYIATRQIEVMHLGVALSIRLRDDGIDCQWQGCGPHGKIGSHVAFIPTSFQSATLMPPDKMR